ncbi:VENN motif pre-toxin domain-containing protein [Erwinia persicina]|nr:VENN motif pre-toxin domain-containing protein [Erwinia persicina]
MSESEKQQVSALSELAAGFAGGLATGDTGGAGSHWVRRWLM